MRPPLIRYTLGDAVRKLRKSKGLGLRELAAKAEVDYTSASRLENRSDRSELRTIERIASALDTTVAELWQYADPVFLTKEQSELLTAFDALDQDRKQKVLTDAQRRLEAQRHEGRAPATEAIPDQPKKATG